MAYPSTFADIRAAVTAKLRLHVTDDAARVNDWINQVYAEVCVETEAIQTSGTSTLTANVASYTLSASIARIKAIVATTGGSTGRPLNAMPMITIREYRANNAAVADTGSVTHYALFGINRIEFWPTPAAADTITFDYVAFPTALSANGDLPALPEPYASKVLEYGALAEAADFLGNPKGPEYRQMFEYWMKKMRAQKNQMLGGHVQQIPVVSYPSFAGAHPSVDTGA